MAELVHLRLEHGLQELEEMKRIKLFTAEEISKIAKKRKMYEYRLRRRMKKKEDFLQYIEFEICLLLLISKRRQRLLIESKKDEIDNSIAKKINRLFKAVISRYPDDEKLWLNQIDYFKRMKWNDSINALFTKILQTHSRKPNLWIMAAKWEMDENNSFDNARRIFQRGVLLNPKSEDLWREYFRMELKYIEMIKKRQEVLQLGNIKDTSTENDAVLKGDIVKIVYDKAVEEIQDGNFALSFLNICLEFDFTAKLIDHIANSIQNDFPVTEDTLNAMCKLPLLHINERIEKERTKNGLSEKSAKKLIFKEICKSYEEAVKTFPTAKMWSFYLDFLFARLKQCQPDAQKAKDKIETMILFKMAEADAVGSLAMDYYIQWTKLLMERGERKEALDVSTRGARKFRTVSLWTECLHLHIQCNMSKNTIYTLFMESLAFLKKKEAMEIWKLGIEWLMMTDPEKVEEFFERGISKGKEISLPLMEMYLETTTLRNDIESSRNLYKRFQQKGTLSPKIHQKMIKIEKAQMKPSLTHIQACYERMVKDFGESNINIWLEYMHFESTYTKDPDSFSMLQWRAKKTLLPELVDVFQSRLTNLLTSGQNASLEITDV